MTTASAPLLHCVVFSRDRPLQLHGYLTSLFEQWHGAATVDVLIRYREPYREAYDAVEDEFIRRAYFWEEEEEGFAPNLQEILQVRLSPLTCFGTDDAVFVEPVEVAALPPLFDADPALLGVSFRLGRTIHRGMFGQPMPQPAFAEGPWSWGDARPTASLRWDCTAPDAQGDWAYPWDTVGTVYRTDYVRRMVAGLAADGLLENPSTLEHQGAQRWHTEADGARFLRCWLSPRLVLPTVNVVQTAFPNGTVGDARLDPAFLLECWERGLRLDTWRYAHTRPQPDTWRVGDLYLRRAG